MPTTQRATGGGGFPMSRTGNLPFVDKDMADIVSPLYPVCI